MTLKRIGEVERKYVNEVLQSEFRTSKLTNMTTRFEQAFAEKFGVRFAISHVNGTSTIHSALAAAGVGPGDEVIVPPLTMASTTLAILYQNAIPVFADVDLATFNIDPERIAESISPRTRAIVPVALYGLSPDFDPIMRLAKKHNLTVIEDDAECYLGYYNEKVVGSIGHMASFSLQASKHITSGEGGVVLTDEQELADRVRAFSIVGYDIVRAKQGKITKDVLQSPDYARHTSLGFKYKMPDICAAVALAQLERLEELVQMRQECAEIYSQAVDGCGWLTPQRVPEGCVHSYYTYVLRLHLDQVDFTWHEFRKKFMDLGGDGFYAAWLLTYNEPMWGTNDFRLKTVVNYKRFQNDFRGYFRSRCHNAETVQPQIMQFKTSYLNRNEIERQADILSKTVAHFQR